MRINIIYGEGDFEELFKKLVEEKVSDLILEVKSHYDLRYNDNNYLSTIKAEVDKDE